MKRMVTFWAVGLGLFTYIKCAEGAQSEWVYAGSDGKLVYKMTPAGDRIMDFSSTGYMGGGVAVGRPRSKRRSRRSSLCGIVYFRMSMTPQPGKI